MVRISVVNLCDHRHPHTLLVAPLGSPSGEANVLNTVSESELGSVACGDIDVQSRNLTFYVSPSDPTHLALFTLHTNDYDAVLGTQLLFAAFCDRVVRLV